MFKPSRSLAIAAVAAGALAAASTSVQAASINQLCHPGTSGTTITYGPFNATYFVGHTGWVRIDGFPSSDKYSGHDSGQPTGTLLRSSIEQSSCQ